MNFPSPSPVRSSLLAGAFLLLAAGARAQTEVVQTYTTDADFDLGTLTNVNHLTSGQLQLDVVPPAGTAPFVWFTLSGRDSVVRVDANTGTVLGEYRCAPLGLSGNPSRTSVDSQGNVWVGNRAESSSVGGMPKGSVVKIGLVVGGTRVNANGTPNVNGEYLAPPFQYSTAIDRDGDGLIRTSRGLGDVFAWPNVTDGVGGANGLVQDALDETILVFQRTSGVQVRHVSVDANDDVWVGGYIFFSTPQLFDKLAGGNGTLLTSFLPGCGGHGGGVDPSAILWSVSNTENSILRHNLQTATEVCVPVASQPHGLTIDANGFIWVGHEVGGGNAAGLVTKIDPAGNIVPGFPVRSGGGANDRTLTVTPADNHVWIGNSQGDDVTRLDNNGNQVAIINLGITGAGPRGLDADANGKVWVSCFGAGTAKRIDPNAGTGAVDLTVQFGSGSAPYNFDDMAGEVPLATQQPNGSWSVITDSGAPGTEYGRISWNATIPASTSFIVEFRAADSLPALALLPFQPAQNNLLFSGVFGRFIEVKTTFLRANPNVTASPILFDLTIEKLSGPDTPDVCPPAGSRNPGSLLVFPEFDNRQGDMTLLTVTNTAQSGSNIKIEYVYIGRVGPQDQMLDCLEFNRTETLTPNDTKTLITKLHNPSQSQGYVYVFVKDAVTGQAIAFNRLIGNTLVINGIEALQYSHNPFTFCGVGEEGTPTDHDGDGRRDLDGFEYSQSSDETYVPRFIGQDLNVVSQLVLINLTGGTAFDATLDLLIFNDNEEPFSAQTSFRCWEKQRLVLISNVFENDFLKASTGHAPGEAVGGYEYGWFKLDGLVASSTATSIADPAFLAVLVEGIGSFAVSDLPFEVGEQANGDLLPLGIFGDTTQ